MKRLTLMSMVVVAGLLVALAIAVVPRGDKPGAVADDAAHHRLCKMVRWTDPDWWEKSCKI